MPTTPQHNRAHRSPNRRLLLVWLATALFIPFLSTFGRPLQHFIYKHAGETITAWVIGLLLIGMGLSVIRWLAGRSLNGKPSILLLVTAILTLAFISISAYLPQTEERLHFVTFGLLGFFSKRLFPIPLTIIITLVWSGGDELFQAWLPDRVGDWRDVAMNFLACTTGLILASIGNLKKFRRKEPPNAQ